MLFGKQALCGALVAAAFTGSALAGNSSAYVVTGSSDRFVQQENVNAAIAKSQVQTYVRIYPNASGPLTSVPGSGDRILPYLAQVQYARSFNTYVNPYQNLDANRPGNAGIDEGHSLKRAQRMYLAATTGSTATIVVNDRARSATKVAVDDIQPRAIIHIPRKFRDLDRKPEPKADDQPRRIAAAD